jgi:cytochrome c5
MSSSDHDDHHDDHHEGPIKTPKQLLVLVLFSFIAPVLIIIALVYMVTSSAKPAGDLQAIVAEAADKKSIGLAGLSSADLEQGVKARIQKVGMVEIKDANRPLKAGEEIYKAQCAACHAAGVANSPKFGDTAAWSARIATGYDALLTSALKGKGAMAAQGGGDFEDAEIGRAVVYMTAAVGGSFPVPERAAPGAAATPAVAASAAVASK